MVKEMCKMCNQQITQIFHPMKEWNMQGPICGDCYSKKIATYYPGEHVRVNTGKD